MIRSTIICIITVTLVLWNEMYGLHWSIMALMNLSLTVIMAIYGYRILKDEGRTTPS